MMDKKLGLKAGAWLLLAALASHTPVLHILAGSLGFSMAPLWLSRLSPLALCLGLWHLYIALHLNPNRLATGQPLVNCQPLAKQD